MFYIMNVGTERLHGKNSYSRSSYLTERGAKGACTRLNTTDCGIDSVTGKKLRMYTEQWKVITKAEWDARPVKTHMVKNLMTGVMVEESVDTPFACSVASEAYWST